MRAELKDDRLTDVEATFLALHIHADTDSLCFEPTTPGDAQALAWLMELGASQAGISAQARVASSSAVQSSLQPTNSTISANLPLVAIQLPINSTVADSTFFEQSPTNTAFAGADSSIAVQSPNNFTVAASNSTSAAYLPSVAVQSPNNSIVAASDSTSAADDSSVAVQSPNNSTVAASDSTFAADDSTFAVQLLTNFTVAAINSTTAAYLASVSVQLLNNTTIAVHDSTFAPDDSTLDNHRLILRLPPTIQPLPFNCRLTLLLPLKI
jgi:hypothetical protein